MCSGKWTRVQSKKGVEEKSVIDYVLTKDQLAGALTDFLIDEERMIAPFWIRESKKKGKVRQHSDHNPFVLNYSIPQSTRESSGWRLSSQGLEEFSNLTKSVCPISHKQENDVFKTQLTNAMDSCFCQKKKGVKSHPNVHKINSIHHKPLLDVMKILISYIRRGKSEGAAARKYVTHIQDLQNKKISKKEIS